MTEFQINNILSVLLIILIIFMFGIFRDMFEKPELHSLYELHHLCREDCTESCYADGYTIKNYNVIYSNLTNSECICYCDTTISRRKI